jgi:hypothetical protein
MVDEVAFQLRKHLCESLYIQILSFRVFAKLLLEEDYLGLCPFVEDGLV